MWVFQFLFILAIKSWGFATSSVLGSLTAICSKKRSALKMLFLALIKEDVCLSRPEQLTFFSSSERVSFFPMKNDFHRCIAKLNFFPEKKNKLCLFRKPFQTVTLEIFLFSRIKRLGIFFFCNGE